MKQVALLLLFFYKLRQHRLQQSLIKAGGRRENHTKLEERVEPHQAIKGHERVFHGKTLEMHHVFCFGILITAEMGLLDKANPIFINIGSFCLIVNSSFYKTLTNFCWR